VSTLGEIPMHLGASEQNFTFGRPRAGVTPCTGAQRRFAAEEEAW